MANYTLSALLTVKDGLTAALRSAAKAAGDLSKGFGSVKDSNIRLNVEGMDKLKRLREMARGMKFSPLNISARDNATPTLSRIKAEVSALSGKAHNILVNVKANGMEQLRGLKQNVGEMTSGMMLASGAGVMGVAGIGYGIADTINTYKDFDYQMKRNKALFTAGMDAGESQAIYQQLMDTARKYGSTMIYTNAEVGRALEYMALAGWDAQTSMQALPSVLNAAVASGEDLGMVSDIITDDMTALGYKAGTYVKNGMGEMVEATQHFSDVLLRTTLRSNTNFQQLGYAMKYAAPLAHSLGYSIEDVAIAMGLMANNGIKADMAGTALRGLLVRMAKAPKQAAEAMKDLGVEPFDTATGKAKGLMQNLMQIRAALKGKDAESMLDFVEQMSGEEIGQRGEVADFLKEEMAANGGKLTEQSLAKLASQFSGTYALAGFLAMMNSTDEDIKKLMTEIYQKSDGTGAEINKEMMDTLQGDLKTLQSAWEDFQFELMNGKGADGLRNFLKAVTTDINAFKTALKDGFDVGDVMELLGNVVGQLRDKFLALDGIGSILAGGVLMAGFRKLINVGLRVKNLFAEIMKLGAATAATSATTASTLPPKGSALSSVGTMNVKAGVVNLAGNIKGGASAGTSTAGGRNSATSIQQQYSQARTAAAPQIAAMRTQSALTAAQNTASAAAAQSRYAQARATALWNQASQTSSMRDIAAARNASIAAKQAQAAERSANMRVNVLENSWANAQRTTTNVANEANAARWANARSAAGGGAAIAGIFGVMDVMSQRSMGKLRVEEIDTQIADQKRILQDLRGNSEVSQEQLAKKVTEISELEASRNEIIRQNGIEQTTAIVGATGMVAGTAIGSALGSIAGPIGTMIGGMVGGMVGQKIGEFAGNYGVENGFFSQNSREVNGAAIETIVGNKIIEDTKTFDKTTFDGGISATEKEKTTAERYGLVAPEFHPEKSAESTGESTTASSKSDASSMGNFRSATDADDLFNARMIAINDQTERLNRQFKLDSEIRQSGKIRSDQILTPQNFQTQPVVKLPEIKLPEFKTPLRSDQSLTPQNFQTQPVVKLPEIKPLEIKTPLRSDQSLTPTVADFQSQPPTKLPEFKTPEFNFGNWLEGLFFSKAAASAEFTPEQLAQRDAMERGEIIQPQGIQATQPQGIQSIENTESLTSTTENLTALNSMTENLTTTFTTATELFNNFGTTVTENLTSTFESVNESFSTFGTSITENLTSIFEGASEFITTFGTSITENLTSTFTSVSEYFSTFGTSITENLNASFTGATEIFASLGEQMSTGLLTAQASAETSIGMIRASFDSGIQSIQAAWGALPGFFDGVFSGLGGAASAAGAAIYGGLTAVIGAVIGAWQSAAATISGIISSISSMASSVGSMLPSFGGVAHNYLGTASFEGGFTEVNEHGGELMILPTGTKIYPHATTQELLRHEIHDKLRETNNFSESGIGEIEMPFAQPNFAVNENLPTADFDLPVPQFNLPQNTNTSTDNSTSNNINFGGVTINNTADLDEFLHKIQQLISGAARNSVQV